MSNILTFPEQPGMQPQPTPAKKFRRSSIGDLAQRIWDARPMVVSAKYVINVEADLMVAGIEVPKRSLWLDRFWQGLESLRFYRPIIMTYQQKLDLIADASTDGLMRGMDRRDPSSGGAV